MDSKNWTVAKIKHGLYKAGRIIKSMGFYLFVIAVVTCQSCKTEKEDHKTEYVGMHVSYLDRYYDLGSEKELRELFNRLSKDYNDVSAEDYKNIKVEKTSLHDQAYVVIKSTHKDTSTHTNKFVIPFKLKTEEDQ